MIPKIVLQSNIVQKIGNKKECTKKIIKCKTLCLQ